MIRVKIITTSIALITAGAGLILLGAATLSGAPRSRSRVRTSAPSRYRKPVKPTWHSGPASTPPETELVPSAPPPAPPVTSTSLIARAKLEKPAAVNHQAVPLVRSVRSDTSAALVETAHPTKADEPRNSPDREARRIEDEFARLRDDTGARNAFYNDLRDTVERVRASTRSGNPDQAAPARGLH